MSVEVRVPKLGMSMTEGVLVEWLVSDGAVVEEGTPIYSLEIEKACQEVPAPAGGVLRIIGKAGETYAVGDLIARIERGEASA